MIGFSQVVCTSCIYFLKARFKSTSMWYIYVRNCKNLPPLFQIHRHNQFLKTKPSSQDNLHFKNEIQQVIDPHRMIKLSSSQMKNGRKQTPSSWQLDFVYCLFFTLFCLISFELTLEHQLSWLNCYRIFRATSKLSHFTKKNIAYFFHTNEWRLTQDISEDHE